MGIMAKFKCMISMHPTDFGSESNIQLHTYFECLECL